MATKRMFSNSIIDRDDFCMLSPEAQLLYFHLGLKADDDGFVQTMKILRILGFDDQPLEELEQRGFVIRFDSTVVITHWLINNELKRDRYHATPYQGLKQQLGTDENKAYFRLEPRCIQEGTAMDTQYSVAQPSVEKPSEKSPAEAGEGSPEGGGDPYAATERAFFKQLEEHGALTDDAQAKVKRFLREKGVGYTSDFVDRLVETG